MFAGVDLLDLSEDDLKSMGLKDLALTNRVLKESALLVVSLIYEPRPRSHMMYRLPDAYLLTMLALTNFQQTESNA